jgi:RHS repeat-associated protein
VPGQTASNTLVIPLSGDAVPSSLRRIDLEVSVAGEDVRQSFAAATNLSATFTWDGKDAYGRAVQGVQTATVRIGYVYGGIYFGEDQANGSFGGVAGSPISIDTSRIEITVWQEQHPRVGMFDARAADGLGGWTLDVQHAYDPSGQVLHLGDGTVRNVSALTPVIDSYVQASLTFPLDNLAAAADGSVYLAEGASGSRIQRVTPDGTRTTIAGSDTVGAIGFAGDGGPATQALLNSPRGIAFGPDGSLYFCDWGNNRVRRIGVDGIINTVAGNGVANFAGDNGPATQAGLNHPQALAVGSDGSIYIADSLNFRVRRVSPDGTITTVAGGGSQTSDGVPAIQSLLFPAGVAIGPDGSLYIPDNGGRVRRVTTDGIITTFAGTGASSGDPGDGLPATQAVVSGPVSVQVGPDGVVYIACAGDGRVRVVRTDGVITTLAGGGTGGIGGPAAQARFPDLPNDVAVGPDGSVYVADFTDAFRIHQPLPQFNANAGIIASEDGNQLYQFDPFGRHQQTLDTLTGAALYRFGYDGAGRLTSITDGDNNLTRIDRDANGNPTAIVAPFGQRTLLTVDPNGYLASITDSAGGMNQYSYSVGGLMTTFTDPVNHVHHFSYDAVGRLHVDQDPAGGSTTLDRTETANGFQITVTKAMTATQNLVSTYLLEELPNGNEHRVNTGPDGLHTDDVIRSDSSETIGYPDGTVVNLVQGPDPRWGMQAPLVTSIMLTSPSGFTSSASESESVTLGDQSNRLSVQMDTRSVTINGRSYTTTFDATTHTFTEATPEGRHIVTVVDGRGNPISKQFGDLAPIELRYDTHGRITNVVQGTGSAARALTFNYDAMGNLVGFVDSLNETIGVQYDAAGRTAGETLPAGQQIALGRDANDNVTSITPPSRPVYAFGYTPTDLLQTVTAPDVGTGSTTTSYSYNLAGQLTQITQPGGHVFAFGYDSAGRLSSISVPDGTRNYAYDPISGQLATITSSDGGTLSFMYDATLPISTAWGGAVQGSVSRSYNSDFGLSSESVDGANTVNFQYDRDGLRTQAGNLSITYDSQDGLLSGTALAGLSTTTHHDQFGETDAESADFNGNAIYLVQYVYDNLGRITEKTETIGGQTHTFDYSYDADSRLTTVRQDGTLIATYAYDSNGNRVSLTTPSRMLVGTYNAQDELTQYGQATYVYNAEGESTAKTVNRQTTTYGFDALGNLQAVTLPDSTQISYVLDGSNRRIGKRVNGTLVQGLLYDDQSRVVAELDGANNVISCFVYGTRANAPDYMIKGGATYRIISDELGSPRLVIDVGTGAIVQRMDYDEFGNVVMDTNPGFQPFGFTGGIYDRSTGLTHFGAREYDATTGRWISRDPLLFDGGDTNLYGYVQNNPLNLIDPAGDQPQCPGDSNGGTLDYCDSLCKKLAQSGECVDHATCLRNCRETRKAAEKEAIKDFLDPPTICGSLWCLIKEYVKSKAKDWLWNCF